MTINYEIEAQQILKGSVQPGDLLTVKVPGGMVEFTDGTSAEIKTPWFKKMLNGKTYILFLTEEAGQEAFIPTGGAQGVFELPAEGAPVKTHSGRRHDPLGKYPNMDVKDFLKEIQRAVK